MLVVVDVLADGGPEDADVVGVDELLEHGLDLVLLLNHLLVQEEQDLLDHQFEVVLLRFHYLDNFVDVLGVALVDLLHDLLDYLLHAGDDLAFVVFEHKLHPVDGVFGGVGGLLLGEGFLEQGHYLDYVDRLALVHLLHALPQHLVHHAALLPHLLLLMRHQQQNRLQNLVEPFYHYLFEVEFLVHPRPPALHLLSEEHEEQLQPLQRLQLAVALALRVCHLNQNRKQQVYKIDAD